MMRHCNDIGEPDYFRNKFGIVAVEDINNRVPRCLYALSSFPFSAAFPVEELGSGLDKSVAFLAWHSVQ